jgi:hypothetical protein
MNNEPAADENPGGFFAHAWCVVRQAHHEGEGLAAKLIGTCSLRQSSRNWPPAILHRPHGELVEPRKNGSAIHLFKEILPTYPTHQNIPYPTPRPFRRECFRKLSKVGKGPALRPVGDPGPGRFSPIMRCWARPIAGAGGPWDRNNRNTNQRLQRSRGTARLSHLLNSQTRKRAWQRPAALQAITAPLWPHRSDARRHRFPTAPDRSWRQSGSPPCRRSSSPAGRTPGSYA